MTHFVFFGVAAVAALVLIRLLTSGRLREKYSAIWIFVGALLITLAAWPGLLTWAADVAGFVLPANLLFMLAIILLLAVTLHLSLEASHLEDETRILAEEIAMLRHDVDELNGRVFREAPSSDQ